MDLDAIIIADNGANSVSATSALRLHIDGKMATIQNLMSYVHHEPFPENEEYLSWSSTLKLNGVYIYSHLKQQGFQVELVNSYNDEKARFKELLERKPKAIIISSTFIMNKKGLRDLVADIRALAPKAFIIAGGAYIYLSYSMLQKELSNPGYLMEPGKKDYLFLEVGQEPAVDLYIVSLRGEKILVEVLENLKKGDLKGLPLNSARLDGSAYSFSERVDDISNAGINTIDWHSLPDSFFRNGIVPMQASVGCPYKCSFCNFTKDERALQVTPLDRLIEDMKAVERRGARYVWFADDNFRLGRNDLNKVCQRIIDEKISLKWMSFIRASTLAHTDPVLLRQAGCIEVQLGLESGDRDVLMNMNKRADPDMYSSVIEKIMRHGINCSCYFIFGFPGETDESATRTRSFIRSIEYPEYDGILTWSIFPFVLSPLSRIYDKDMRAKYKLTGHYQDWQHETMNFSQAKGHVIQCFFELENSSILYRGDNQEMFLSLPPSSRNAFVRYRHECSKLALEQKLDVQRMAGKFRSILS